MRVKEHEYLTAESALLKRLFLRQLNAMNTQLTAAEHAAGEATTYGPDYVFDVSL